MRIKRFDDIVAFKWSQKDSTGTTASSIQNFSENTPAAKYIALHSKNMEVAEISEAAWNELNEASFSSAQWEPFEKQNSIIEEIANWNNETNANSKDIPHSSRVRHLTINVTQICNLGCSYCAAGGDGTYGDPVAKISVEKTLPQLKMFIEKLNGEGNFNITFLGGEPLLYPEGLELIHNYLVLLTAGTKIQLGYNVITNGTLLSSKNIELLNRMKVNLTVSIDGPPEVQDLVRPLKTGGSSSKLVEEGLKNLSKNRSQISRLVFHSVFTKHHTEVLKTYSYLRELGADAYEFTFDVTESDQEANLKFISEFEKAAATAWLHGGERELRRITLFDGYFNALDSQYRKSRFCGSGTSLLSLDAKNRIFACPLDVESKELAVGTGLELNQEKLEQFNPSFIEKNNCQACWAKHLCGGGCLYVHKSLTGSKNKKHDSFCERQRRLIALAVVYYQQSRA